MNVYKDQCHICLDEKTYVNKKNTSCINEDCTGYICKKCWADLHKNNIDVCPMCREPIQFTLSQQLLDFRSMIKRIIAHIVLYLTFYSIGSCMIVIVLFIQKNMDMDVVVQTIKSFKINDMICSLILLPLLGFVMWYIIIFFSIILFRCMIYICPFLNNIYDGDDDEEEYDEEEYDEEEYDGDDFM